MGEMLPLLPTIVGRRDEMGKLKQTLDDAISGKGGIVFIIGEPGIGKTRLVEAFRESVVSQDVKVLAGAASAGPAQPFKVFSNALGEEIGTTLFEEQEYTKFIKIFAINHAGMLIAQASSEEGDLDADIFAGMLSAVQDFVRDSFGPSGSKSGLGRLEYGDMKILIEHGQHLFLTTVFRGSEHQDMRNSAKQTLQSIERDHRQLLENWCGTMSEVEPIQDEISNLARVRFLVRKDMEGVKLENERLRIADAVLECLTATSKERPLLLLLEDLHLADESALFVLSYLARNIEKIPVLLIATARLKENAALDSALEMMREEETITELELGRLEKSTIPGMVEQLYPRNDFPTDFIDSVADRCGGNPLFVIEFLKNMVNEHSIVESNGAYSLVNENYSIPDSIEGVIQSRLSKLGPEALSLAEYASCIGREFDTAIALSIGTIADTSQGWNELQRSGIVVRQNGNASFCHAMYRDVIYSTIEQRWKSAHHKSIGEWYERSHLEGFGDVIYMLARHFSLTREHLKAYEYCIRAGEKARDSYAPEQAISYFTDALTSLRLSRSLSDKEMKASELLENVGDLLMLLGEFTVAIESYAKADEGHSDGIALARLKRKTADAQYKLGEYDLTLGILSKAKTLIGDRKDKELGKVLITESYVLIGRGELDQGLAILHEALDIFREHGGTDSDVGNTLRGIGNVYWRRGEYDAAQRHYEMSLDTMERSGDSQGTAAALNNLGLVHSDKGEPEIALRYYTRALDTMTRTGDKYMMTMVYNNMGLLYAATGRLDLALDYYQRSLELRERIGDKGGIAAALLNMGNLRISMGMPGKALELFERCLRISTVMDDKKITASAVGAIGNVHSQLGNPDRALDFLKQSMGLCEEIGERYTLTHVLDNIGFLMLEKEETAQALEHFARSLKLREEMGDRIDQSWTHFGIALTYLKTGNYDLATRHAEKSRALAEEMNLGMESGACLMALGMILRETGQFDAAAEMLDRAEKIFRDGGQRPMYADALYENGKLNKAKGDKEKARDCLTGALTEFKNMGRTPDIDKCRKALDNL